MVPAAALRLWVAGSERVAGARSSSRFLFEHDHLPKTGTQFSGSCSNGSGAGALGPRAG